MKIKFTHDFRGKLTNEKFYLEGTEIEIEDETGQALIALNHAVDVTPVPPVKADPEPEPEKKPRRASKPKKEADNDH